MLYFRKVIMFEKSNIKYFEYYVNIYYIYFSGILDMYTYRMDIYSLKLTTYTNSETCLIFNILGARSNSYYYVQFGILACDIFSNRT